MFPTIVAGLWPVDFPFKILISGNHTGFQIFFSENPFFHKIIQNSIIKPHSDRRMSWPAIRVMVTDSGIFAGIVLQAAFCLMMYQRVVLFGTLCVFDSYFGKNPLLVFTITLSNTIKTEGRTKMTTTILIRAPRAIRIQSELIISMLE